MRVPEQNYYRKLYEVAAIINSAGSPDKVLGSIVKSVTEAMKAKGCSIMLLTPDKKYLVHSISYGLSSDFTGAGPREVEKSLPETLVGKGRVAIVDDLAQEKERVHYAEPALKEGIVSILSVPMKLHDDIIGEFRVYTGEHRHFSDDDIFFAQAVANLGAIALENSRACESIQKAYDGLTGDFLSFRWSRGGPSGYRT